MPSQDPYVELSRQLLRAVRGRRSQVDLSRRIGYRSNMVYRWEAGECAPSAASFLALCQKQRVDVPGALKGQAEPRLSEFLHVLDVASQRLLDFIATLTDPARLPLVAEAWSRLNRVRDVAYDEPWSHAVLPSPLLAPWAPSPSRALF